jgi:hypothetical protein
MRDDLEAAIATLGDDSGMEPAPDYEPSVTIEVKDEEGKAAETQAKTETPAGEISGEEGKAGVTDAAAGDDTTRRPSDDEQSAGSIEKAPEAWQPAAREGWKDLPESVRTQIHKREGEINKALMDGSDNRKQGEKFNDIAGRYAQVIAAEGVSDPITGFEEMMKVMAQLRMGTPAQKAQKIAQFIGGYGVDVEMLDDILSGQPAPGGNGATPPAGDPNRQYIDQQLGPVHELLGRLNATEKQNNLNRNQAYMAEVVKFKAENEFYTDVQHDMADLCEMAGNRGYDMPLAEAYSKACAMNPEISKVMTERTETARLADGSKTLLSKRNASSSLMSGQQQGVPATEDMDLRQTISAAFDAQTS